MIVEAIGQRGLHVLVALVLADREHLRGAGLAGDLYHVRAALAGRARAAVHDLDHAVP